MGYTGPYSLAARCVTEFLASATAIYLGEAVLANELLPSTKGHNLGFGWVAFGFGFAFFTALQLFGRVSSHVNPAMCLALWVLGELSPGDFFALAGCEVAGMMLGAGLVVLHFWPHFKTTPEPPAAEEDQLLRRRDVTSEAARALAGYATHPDRTMPAPPKNVNDLWSYLLPNQQTDQDSKEVLETYFAADPMSGLVRRRSIQVADLQAHLKNEHVHTVLRRRACPSCQPDLYIRPKADTDPNNQQPADAGRVVDQVAHDHDAPQGNDHEAAITITHHTPDVSLTPVAKRTPFPDHHPTAVSRVPPSVLEKEAERAAALYAAAVTADQNAKLSIFATRPAIFHPLCNFITEVMCTTALVLAALLLEDNAHALPPALKPLYSRGLNSFLIGVIIVVMVLGLGGPTGIAANPARDLGPRLAHWLLPIPGKGSSEFGYGWIPVVAPLCGGALAAGLFKAIKPLFEL